MQCNAQWIGNPDRCCSPLVLYRGAKRTTVRAAERLTETAPIILSLLIVNTIAEIGCDRGWARLESNQRPSDYESPALTD